MKSKSKQPHHPLLGALEELGELSHSHLKQEQGIRGDFSQHQEAKCDAIGDIIIYLSDYCNQNQIDMQQSLEKAWDQVKQRDWTKNKRDGVAV